MKSPSLTMLALASAIACKTVATPQSRGQASATPPAASPVATSETLPGAPLDSTGKPLPRLKPVTGKLFPEGTTEAMICEAINVKEPDLWLRFGHMIPMYTRGTVLVLQAGKAREADIAAFANWYKPKFEPIQASCGDKTLFHLEGFDATPIFNELEERLGIKVLERFDIPIDDQQDQRLSDYCRTDAVLCNDLHKLYYGYGADGLCALAVGDCSFASEADEAQAVAHCRTLPPDQVACTGTLHGMSMGGTECVWRMRKLFCPDFPKRSVFPGRLVPAPDKPNASSD